MKVSHVLYKTNNLQAAVSTFEALGFNVEYGSKHNPHNALIYFSDGPYIELLEKAPIPFYAGWVLTLIGKRKVAERFRYWKNVDEGFFGLCLENEATGFDHQARILDRYNQPYFITKSQRTDPANRTLKWKLLIPHELKLPFLMTPFNINPKPNGVVHPNGVRGIARVSFGTDAHLAEIVGELCNDNMLHVHVGRGVSEVVYDQ